MSYEDHPHATYSVRHYLEDGGMVRSVSGDLQECKRRFLSNAVEHVLNVHRRNTRRIVLYHEHKEYPILVLRLMAGEEKDSAIKALKQLTESTERALSGDESRETVSNHLDALRHARATLNEITDD